MLRLTSFCIQRRLQTNNHVRNYLTHKYKTCMESQVELRNEDIKQNSKFLAFETETFVSKLKLNADSRDELYDRLAKLRSSEETTTASELLNYSVIHYLSNVDMQGLLFILANRTQYGIFVDSFTGCYLMDILLKSENYEGAAQIALELMLQEEFDNELVAALALEACFKYANALSQATANEDTETKEESSEKPTKIRVKYLRNPPENPIFSTANVSQKLIAEALLKYGSLCKNLPDAENFEVLGNVLQNDYEKALNILRKPASSIRGDVAEMSLRLIEQSNAAEPAAHVDEVKAMLKEKASSKGSNESFAEILRKNVEKCVAENEDSLIKTKNDQFASWLKIREQRLQAAVSEYIRTIKDKEAEKTLSEIEARKQLLWFFELKDQLDLDIYKKKVTYPKRWFGKKKKPRVIDDNYVPPEIRKN